MTQICTEPLASRETKNTTRVRTKRKLLWAVGLVVAALVLLGVVPTRRILVAGISVKVTDLENRPVEGYRISQRWTADRYGFGGFEESFTNSAGEVKFAARNPRRPLAFWYMESGYSRLKAATKRGSLATAAVNVHSTDGKYDGFSCVDETCTSEPIHLIFKVDPGTGPVH